MERPDIWDSNSQRFFYVSEQATAARQVSLVGRGATEDSSECIGSTYPIIMLLGHDKLFLNLKSCGIREQWRRASNSNFRHAKERNIEESPLSCFCSQSFQSEPFERIQRPTQPRPLASVEKWLQIRPGP
jgi:hypothetical protein